MKFNYLKVPATSSPAFPDEKSRLRPVINVRLIYRDKSIQYKTVIDSGSDYCIFPASIGKLLTIDVESGKLDKVGGIGYGFANLYFHPIALEIGGISAPCYAGFSYDIDKLGFGILGQKGFFDRFNKVIFEYKKERIELVQ
jgi:hypothetical protein